MERIGASRAIERTQFPTERVVRDEHEREGRLRIVPERIEHFAILRWLSVCTSRRLAS